jgi:hypothetical protein
VLVRARYSAGALLVTSSLVAFTVCTAGPAAARPAEAARTAVGVMRADTGMRGAGQPGDTGWG